MMNYPDKMNMAAVEEYLKDKEYANTAQNMTLVQQLSVYQGITDKIGEELEERRLDQARRIYKEFKHNEYSKRFDCKLKDVISAIMGEESCFGTISLLKREDSEANLNLENIRTFNMFDRNPREIKKIRKIEGFN